VVWSCRGYLFFRSGIVTCLASRGCSITARTRVLPFAAGFFATRCNALLGGRRYYRPSGQSSGSVQDLQRIHRQEQVCPAECLLLPFRMGEVVLPPGVTEQLALHGPAFAVDDLRLEQVQSPLAA